MANTSRRMPRAPEMYIFNTQVGCNEQLVAGGSAQDGAIIADPAHQRTAAWWPGHATNAFYQSSFGQRQSKVNYKRKNLVA
jgi:hypothetical protein